METMNEELTTFLKFNGANLVGFADLGEIDYGSRYGFPFGIAIAIVLEPQIISGISVGPTGRYFDEYKRVNSILDKLGQSVENFLTGKGYRAKARSATFHEEESTLSAKIPHKTTATRAGLGWIGKCALLVTREYGSAVRLTSVLTDAPLNTGKSINASFCGDCTECVKVCPAGAISGRNWEVGVTRESLINAFSCQETAREFSFKMFGERVSLCGRCIIACPWTKKYAGKTV